MAQNIIHIKRASPLTTIQDEGRFGFLEHGISASGAMDKSAFFRGSDLLDGLAGSAIEFTQSGLDFLYFGENIRAAFSGGDFSLAINGKVKKWNKYYQLKNGDNISIKPGKWGNFGYVRFNKELDIKKILNSRATNLTAKLGGLGGRELKRGDKIALIKLEKKMIITKPAEINYQQNHINFIWGVHANLFSQQVRDNFVSKHFIISSQFNRMGMRLIDENNIFCDVKLLNLVSEPLVCGDIQILGDGTPIILMRDHQPTGGYPRIGTIISQHIDIVAQMRPNSKIFFKAIAIK